MTATTSAGRTRELRIVEGLTRTQIVQYAGASGDFNPLHHDEHFVRETASMPGVFAHGMLTMGMTGRLLTDWFGPEAIVEYGARFAAQVWPGDTLTGTARIDDVRRLAESGDRELDITLTTRNQHDEVVLAGTAKVRLDSDE